MNARESGVCCAVSHAPRMKAITRCQSLLHTVDRLSLPKLTRSSIVHESAVSAAADEPICCWPSSLVGRLRLPCCEGAPASQGICRRTHRLHGCRCVRSQRAFSSLQRRHAAGLPFVVGAVCSDGSIVRSTKINAACMRGPSDRDGAAAVLGAGDADRVARGLVLVPGARRGGGGGCDQPRVSNLPAGGHAVGHRLPALLLPRLLDTVGRVAAGKCSRCALPNVSASFATE